MAPTGLPHRPPRSPHLPARPLRRHSPIDRAALTSQNCRWLAAYASSADDTARLHWRNRLVEANLPLVQSVAARFTGICQLPVHDLVQVGCQGLIRAVEAFDSRRTRCLSTFAVPYVRGAIQHELRDREAWIRPPRRLWDLRQRLKGLQEQRRAEGLPPRDRDVLTDARRGSLPEPNAAQVLRQLAIPLSLDVAPCQGGEADGAGSWLDQLADPLSLAQETAPPPDRQCRAQRVWLRRQLSAMEPLQRELVLGRVLLGCTWVELGRQLGLHPRMAERRCSAVLRQLRTDAERWGQGMAPALEGPERWSQGMAPELDGPERWSQGA